MVAHWNPLSQPCHASADAVNGGTVATGVGDAAADDEAGADDPGATDGATGGAALDVVGAGEAAVAATDGDGAP
jgi:hypothetical protein